MKQVSILVMVGITLLGSVMQNATAAEVIISVGYLNNLSGSLNPADIPTPFDPSTTTMLISSGGVATPHDTGVIRFVNLTDDSVVINRGLRVTTERGAFQVWGEFLPIVLAPGNNLVLAETENFNFDTSDSGLGSNPVVSGSVNGMAFSFTDTARVLLGHEEAVDSAETTPYQELGRLDVRAGPDLTVDNASCDGTNVGFRITNVGSIAADGKGSVVFSIKAAQVRCVNETSGQTVTTTEEPTEISCIGAGLAVNPGDVIRITQEIGPIVDSQETSPFLLQMGDFTDVSIPIPEACSTPNVPFELRGCNVSILAIPLNIKDINPTNNSTSLSPCVKG